MKLLGQGTCTVLIFDYTRCHVLGNLGNQFHLLRKDLAWEPGTSYSVPLAGRQAALGAKQ